MFTQDTQIQCPYCGEAIWIEVDPSGSNVQDYIEDCQVCCKPISLHVQRLEDGEFEVQAQGGG